MLQEASATMGEECRCTMDYVISHNADGVREFRRVSEVETRLGSKLQCSSLQSENLFVSVVALVMLFDRRACFPYLFNQKRSSDHSICVYLCVDSDFVLTGCGTLEDW